MPATPYPLPTTIIEPGDGDPAIRLMGRITAGMAFARNQGFTTIEVRLCKVDFSLYQQANAGTAITELAGSLCDGGTVLRAVGDAPSAFYVHASGAGSASFPVMTDDQYLEALTLKPGVFVVREGEMAPRELVRDPLTPGVLRVGLHRYDSKGRGKRNAPAILYVWDEAAMEAKADAGQLTDMEKAFFAMIIQYQRDIAWVESRSASRQ